jgi:glycosyltransferase involved in cell wall biosynthesis
MSHQPDEARVTAVIPAYNAALFLEATIASVYSQTVPPSQVIVIDDGSTDDTAVCLRQLAATLPSSFEWLTKENGGEASARNVGIELAKGAYVAFLDHDDLWHPTKLERQLARFAADPDLALSFTGYRFTFDDYKRGEGRDIDPEVIHHDNWDPDPTILLDQMLSGTCPVGTLSTVLIRAEALTRVTPFDETLLLGSDWEMYLKFLAAGMKMDYLPEVLVDYRWHGTNLSRDTGLLWEHLCLIHDRFFREHAAELPPSIRKGGRRWRMHWHLQTAIDAIQHGDLARSRRHIAQAARIRPLSIRPGWVRMLGVGPPPRD